MNINDFTPSLDLYHQIRGGFVTQGSSLGLWCRVHKINPTNARGCLIGTWNGPKGQALRAELIEESGIVDSYSEAV